MDFLSLVCNEFSFVFWRVQEILAMKSRLEEIEKEAAALREMREAQEREAKAIAAVAAPTPMETEEDAHAVDERSVYVGNVRILHCQ